MTPATLIVKGVPAAARRVWQPQPHPWFYVDPYLGPMLILYGSHVDPYMDPIWIPIWDLYRSFYGS